MKIGICTDTYRPAVNGIVYVTEILRRNFEAMGHEVYIFAPASDLSGKKDIPDDHIIRFPALAAKIPYDDFNTSLFFPPKVVKQIEELNLDVLHFLTPGPVGLLGAYVAKRLNKPLVTEYCTDLFEYLEHYPVSIPFIGILGLIVPLTVKVSHQELFDMMKAGRPRIGATKWAREAFKSSLTVLHTHCSAVIVHSRKSAEQLLSWQNGDRYPVHIIPTGVDLAPATTKKRIAGLKKQWGIKPGDDVLMYLGRISAEKNLDVLVTMMEELIKWRPNAKLVYVGDFDYRETLEEHAKASQAAGRIVFAGKVPHEEIGAAYAIAKVFVFPSLTDTQSLTLHEAALAGLPIVMIDEPVTEVVKDGKNGFFCKNDPVDMADKVKRILEDPALRKKMSETGQKIAAKFSERAQCEKILTLYETIVAPPPKE